MNKVKRAIIMAAGKGTRLNPITLTTPKPLIKVNGIRMIDTIIDALHENGIYEIYVVIGYLKEKFYELLKDYPDVKLIENPYYDTCNNISSLYMARDHLEDAIILDADQIVYNKEILNPFFDKSCYLVTPNLEYTKEWVLKTNEDNIVISCSRDGGSGGFELHSVSKWSKNDGLKLKKCLEKEFINKKNAQIYWDDIALFCYPNEFQLGVEVIKNTDIVEIDSLEELMLIDNSYIRGVNDYEK